MLVKPWLRRAHPNFFVVYAATLLYHLWCGLNAVAGPDSWFRVPALKHVNDVADPVVWGIVNVAIASALWIGLHLRTFTFARVALAAGLLWVSVRFMLLALGLATGEDVANSLPNLFLCGAVHLAQTLEPPSNIATQRSQGLEG